MPLLQVSSAQQLEGLRIICKELRCSLEMSDSAYGVVRRTALLALLELVFGFGRYLRCTRVHGGARPFRRHLAGVLRPVLLQRDALIRHLRHTDVDRRAVRTVAR